LCREVAVAEFKIFVLLWERVREITKETSPTIIGVLKKFETYAFVIQVGN
jgi:hypothetical protein